MNTENPMNESGSKEPPGPEVERPDETDSTAPDETESTAPDETESTAPDETDSTAPDETESTAPDKPAPADSGKPPKSSSFLPSLALLLALVALAGTAWMWWQDQAAIEVEEDRLLREIARLESSDSELSLKLSQLRNELDSSRSDDINAEFEALQQRIESDRDKLAAAEQAIQEQLALSRSLQAATDSMHGRLAAAEAAVTGMSTRELDAGGELDLAEVDYLLRLANERLKLFSDPEAADQALEVADMHLAALDNPMYLGVRQDIASARRELAGVDVPDYLEIAAELDAVQQLLPKLVFEGEQIVSAEAVEDAGSGWWDKVKSVFAGLVTVRRSTDHENERISIQDKDFIRQRIWLQLEIAHLSLMRRDQQGFRTALERSRRSITEWFQDSSSLQEAVRRIDGLQAAEIEVEMPDITAPWSTLRLLRTARPGAAPAAQGPLEAPESRGEMETGAPDGEAPESAVDAPEGGDSAE